MSSPDISDTADRLFILSSLLRKMAEGQFNLTNKEFWKLQREFDSHVQIFQLEDEINACL